MGISAIGPVNNNPLSVPQLQSSGLSSAGGAVAGSTPAGQLTGNAPAVGEGSSILALSTTSIQASSESLVALNNMPMLSSNEALGAALLLLVMQYLQTADPTEKQNLLDVIMTLAGTQQQSGAGGGGSSLLMYNSSSLSIESTQMIVMGSPAAIGAYSGASATAQQTPQVDAGAPARIDVIA